jgi:anaphase-promoting complex subunit 3
MYFSWAVDLDPKGANNQIKEAVDKRYLPEDDDISIDDVDLTGEVGVGEELNNESRLSDNDDLE